MRGSPTRATGTAIDTSRGPAVPRQCPGEQDRGRGAGTTAGFGRLELGLRQAATGTCGVPTSRSASGARCGRTTAPTARRGRRHPARPAAACGCATPGPGTAPHRRRLAARDGRRAPSSTRSSARSRCAPAPAPTAPRRSCCSATTRPTPPGCTARPARATPRTASTTTSSRGAATVNPERRGSKCAAWYRVAVGGGQTVELRLRLPRSTARTVRRRVRRGRDAQGRGRRVLRGADARRGLRGRGAGDAPGVRRDAVEQAVLPLRRRRWLDGDPAQPPPPPSGHRGRNARWRTFDAYDVLSMPDTWEYPWFAAWDLAFHCVALAHVDPAFAKYQLTLLCREWFQHPNGALPAYEWDFGDVNPPVQAWAALEVFALDGGRDLDFLSRVFDKLLVNFTWWVNREDADGREPVRGRVHGPGQHRPDRPLAPARRRDAGAVRQHRLDGGLRRVDGDDRRDPAPLSGTGPPSTWCRRSSSTSPRSATRSTAPTCGTRPTACSTTGSCTARGRSVPIKVRSIASMIPMLAGGVVSEEGMGSTLSVTKRFARFLRRHGLHEAEGLEDAGLLRGREGSRQPARQRGRDRPGQADARRRCSTPPSSSSRTGCGRSRPATATTRPCCSSTACARAWTTSPPSRRPRCSAATPTGAGRCGSR